MDLLKKINYILDWKQKIRLIQLFFIIVVGAFVELMGVSMILPFIDVMMNSEVIMNKAYLRYFYELFHFQSVDQFLILIAFCLIAVYIVKNIYVAAMYDAQYRFTYRNQRRVSARLFRCYLEQDYLFFVKNNSAELMRNVNTDVSTFFLAILQFLQLATEICVCIVLFVYLLCMDKTITIGISIILIFFVFAFVKLFRKRLTVMGEHTRKYSAEMNKWLLQGVGGIKEIKVMNREPFFCNQYDKAYYHYSESQRKYSLLNILPRPVMEMFCVSGLLLVVIFKLFRGVHMAYFVTTLSVFAVAAFRMLPSFNRITNYLNGIMFSMPSVNKLYDDLMEMEELMRKVNEKEKMAEDTFNFTESIVIENLTFSYPGTEKPVLKRVNLEIKKNLSVAFVGASGAGKTTLADIILGVLEAQEGNVCVDGKNIKEHMRAWQKKLGYIPQMIYIMDDTLRNNIAIGIPNEEIDEERIWRAIEEAQLKEFVLNLEDGIDTTIGENGIRLSGGQRQRIGIARALYHDSEVLVLDEATSALDNETEAAVMEAIRQLSGRKTLIIIAHRLTTVKNCDIIYKVENQKVCESVLEL